MNIYPLLVPAGNDTEVQFNDNGLFAGDSTFTFTKGTKNVDMQRLTLTDGGIYLLSDENIFWIDEKIVVAIVAGNPMGLLLALTYPATP